jgi:hypothetical protein
MEETIGMNLPEMRSAGDMMVRAPLEWASAKNSIPRESGAGMTNGR